MRKTRVENDQFWDNIDYNVDEYMKKEDARQRSPSKKIVLPSPEKNQIPLKL